MRAVLLSDAHIDAVDDPVQDRLVAFLDGLAADRLILLGDIFHRWWELPGHFRAHLPTVSALRRLTARGVVVDLLRGNHDFAVRPQTARALGVGLHDTLELELDGLRVWACHGDQAVRSWRYHGYHRVLRGWPFHLALRAAGPDRAWELLGRLAGSPERDGSPPVGLLEAQQRYARQRLEEGFDLVVMGHSHVPAHHHEELGQYVNTGSFRDAGTWLEIDGGRVSLRDQAL